MQLHLQYNELRIMVHRQFICSLELTHMPSPALTVCASAARASLHLVSALYARIPDRIGVVYYDVRRHIPLTERLTNYPQAGYAGLVLVVCIAQAQLHHLTLDRKQAVADMEMILSILRSQKDRWCWALRHAYV